MEPTGELLVFGVHAGVWALAIPVVVLLVAGVVEGLRRWGDRRVAGAAAAVRHREAMVRADARREQQDADLAAWKAHRDSKWVTEVVGVAGDAVVARGAWGGYDIVLRWVPGRWELAAGEYTWIGGTPRSVCGRARLALTWAPWQNVTAGMFGERPVRVRMACAAITELEALAAGVGPTAAVRT